MIHELEWIDLNGDESGELLEFYNQNYLENRRQRVENERLHKYYLDEYLENERFDAVKNHESRVNFKKFTVDGISISRAIYGKGRISNTKQIEELISMQKSVNLRRIANSLNINPQDLNFVNTKSVKAERLCNLISSQKSTWTEMAKLYGTNHTAIQLFKFYKIYICPNLKNTEFTQEEEVLLERGIELYGNNSAAITTLLPGRDLRQIHAKRKYFLKRVGKWDKDEDERLMKAVEEQICENDSPTIQVNSNENSANGERTHSTAKTVVNITHINWVLVSEVMQFRNAEQCRNRYVNKLNPVLDHSKLTREEKNRIIDLVAELGVGKLKMVAANFPTRSPQMITNFYKVHSRKKATKPFKRRKCTDF